MSPTDQVMAVTRVVAGNAAVPDIAQPRLSTVIQRPIHDKVGDEVLKSLARALGRQAARRHLHRGISIAELALALAAGALVLAVLLYAGVLHTGSR